MGYSVLASWVPASGAGVARSGGVDGNVPSLGRLGRYPLRYLRSRRRGSKILSRLSKVLGPLLLVFFYRKGFYGGSLPLGLLSEEDMLVIY